MIVINAPDNYKEFLGKYPSVFLAGSIEMGKAIDWQADIIKRFSKQDVLFLNPRRKNWDSSWQQSIDNPNFKEQVEWELQALEDADIIFMYLQAGTMSPISLLEFGLHAKSNPEKLVICCPDGFWRKGNVDITANKYGIFVTDNMNEAFNKLLSIISH